MVPKIELRVKNYVVSIFIKRENDSVTCVSNKFLKYLWVKLGDGIVFDEFLNLDSLKKVLCREGVWQ